jgi:hypothetical protein
MLNTHREGCDGVWDAVVRSTGRRRRQMVRTLPLPLRRCIAGGENALVAGFEHRPKPS